MRYDLHVNPATGPLPALPTGTSPDHAGPGAFHRSLPGYHPTPLRESAELARLLGVRTVLVKDEAVRLGLPSFKILGASWATVTAVLRHWVTAPVTPLTLDRVAAAIPRPRTRRLVAATDGNHGRGVARMARLLGVAATILVPAGTAEARTAAIAGEGAEVVVVDGSYDDAIAASAALAGPDTLVVSDTSWPGYEHTPAAVIAGYATLFAEIDAETARRGLPAPTVVALQAGVGAFAAAGVRHFRAPDRPGPPPRTVVVEPTSANCLMASARAGRLAEVPGPHRSTMAGLNCGLPSVLAWPTVRAGTDVFLAVDDDAAHRAMAELARASVVAGESGAAGLGGLLAVALTGDPADRARAGLTPEACVLVVNTEGATDPVNYHRVVGHHAATADDVPAGVA
ncbi:diaminopropionate ammonia-lyase [Micromonospora sp. RP3T]|uniref:diaminopropionate ammonia-lyase n=1 Tax=Micromonospora sp. RP3T TaxID=2135446 RepID=UPI000D177CCB|nr:diaminopropionate ammonia-lyase [Micromonospora sp. RP3T]PTA47489.1 diaminopropionate ammonia-lyase [Micromonospora sp. RP3T]